MLPANDFDTASQDCLSKNNVVVSESRDNSPVSLWRDYVHGLGRILDSHGEELIMEKL